MKRIILSLALAFSFASLRVQAIEHTQMEMTVDQGPAIGLTVGTIGIASGVFFLTEHYFLRKKVQELEKLPALQQQLECESLKYTDFQAMKNELKNSENLKLESAGLIIGGICALAMGITSL